MTLILSNNYIEYPLYINHKFKYIVSVFDTVNEFKNQLSRKQHTPLIISTGSWNEANSYACLRHC
jgi:hypothetical protein